jgi:hypothetical protein
MDIPRNVLFLCAKKVENPRLFYEKDYKEAIKPQGETMLKA